MGLRLIYYYAIILIVLTVSFFVGYTLLTLIKPYSQKRANTLFSVFSNTVIGLIVLVSTYSILITSGKTVSWLYVLLLLGYGYFFRFNYAEDNTPILKGYYLKAGLSLFVVSVFFYLLYLSSLLDFTTFRFTDTFCDWQYYSKLSQYLNLGFESNTQFDNIAFGSTFTPYHYFELWIVAFISRAFEIPSQIATSIIMPSVLGSVAFVGIWGFATKLNYKNAILSFLLLFVSSVTFFSSGLNRLGFGLPLLAGDISSVVSYFKLYPLLIFFVLAIHNLLQRNILLFCCSLLFLPVVSFILAPSVLTYVWLLAIYFLRNRFEFSGYYKLGILLLTFSILILLYYFKFWDVTSLANVITVQDMKLMVLELTKPALLVLNISPFFLFVFLLNRKLHLTENSKKWLVSMYFTLLILSAILAVISLGNYDGIQFFTNLFIPLSTAVISLFLLRLKFESYTSNLFVKLIFLVLLLSSMFYSVKYIFVQRNEKHNSVFIKQVTSILKPVSNKVVYCGFLHSTNYYSAFHMHSISNVFRAGEVLDCYSNNILEVGLSDFEALDWLRNKYKGSEETRRKGLSRIPEGTFYKYVELQKQNGTFKSVDSEQINFIERYRINYIFIQNDARVSPQLQKRIVLLAAESNKMGYSFYKINR